MNETEKTEKTFHIAAVAGLITGYVLGNGDDDGFTAQHELAEHVLGHSIWTHEFAGDDIWTRLRAALVAAHPILEKLPTPDIKGCKARGDDVMTYIRAYLTEASAICGERLSFKKGSEARTEHPIESFRRIAPNKPLIVVVGVEEEKS